MYVVALRGGDPGVQHTLDDLAEDAGGGRHVCGLDERVDSKAEGQLREAKNASSS